MRNRDWPSGCTRQHYVRDENLLVVVMQIMRGGKSNHPEAHHQRADGEDPVARAPVLRGEGRSFAGAKNLAADADGHQECA